METVKISVNDEVIELTGDEAKAHESDRAKEHTNYLAAVAKEQRIEIAKQSAQAKLAALGLTDDEVRAIIGA